MKRGLIEQRVEDVAGAIRVRKELPVVFLVQGDAGRLEEADRRVHGQRPQHPTDDGGWTAPVVAVRDDAIRDVAAATAADEDLRARRPRAIEQPNAEGRVPHAREDRGGEASRAGADDQNVTVRITHVGIHDIVIAGSPQSVRPRSSQLSDRTADSARRGRIKIVNSTRSVNVRQRLKGGTETCPISRTPAIAAVWSALIPGIGQFYNGDFLPRRRDGALSPAATVISPELPQTGRSRLESTPRDGAGHPARRGRHPGGRPDDAADQGGKWGVAGHDRPDRPGAYRYNFNVDGVTTIESAEPPDQGIEHQRLEPHVRPRRRSSWIREVPRGAIAEVTYYSTALQMFRRMHVYTPPGYEMKNDKYPVFYLLHGAGDSDDAWPSVGRAGFILDNLLADKKAKPMIVVMPAGHTRRGPGGTGGRAGTEEFVNDFNTDLQPYIEKHYRVLTDRANTCDRRAVDGRQPHPADRLSAPRSVRVHRRLQLRAPRRVSRLDRPWRPRRGAQPPLPRPRRTAPRPPQHPRRRRPRQP